MTRTTGNAHAVKRVVKRARIVRLATTLNPPQNNE